jgi:hypothetical protein
MISGSDLQLLKSSEKVLLHFLTDALTSIAENYFETIVVPYLGSSHYRGTASLINRRGVRKTSLKEFDLQFLLQLFEFSVDRRKVQAGGVIMPDLASFLPLTQSTVYHKVRAAVAVRNDWVHDETSAIDETKRVIDITKLLDLFREEVQHVVMMREDIFTAETRNVVRAYTEKLSAALLQQPEVQQPEVQQPEVQQPEVQQPEVQQPEEQQPEVQQPEVQQPEVQQPQPQEPETPHREAARVAVLPDSASLTGTPAGKAGPPVMLLSVIGIFLVGGFLLYRFAGNQSEKKAPYQLHIAACEPLLPIHLDAARRSLTELIQTDTLGRIVVYSSNNTAGTTFELGSSEKDMDEILTYLQMVSKLETAFDLRTLFNNAIPAMSSSGDSAASLVVIGSVGEFSRQEERAFEAVPDTLYPEGTGTTLRRARARLQFLRVGAPTAADTRVINGFREASIECVERTL